MTRYEKKPTTGWKKTYIELERDLKWDEKHVCLAMKRILHCGEKRPTVRWTKTYYEMKKDKK